MSNFFFSPVPKKFITFIKFIKFKLFKLMAMVVAVGVRLPATLRFRQRAPANLPRRGIPQY